MGSDFTILRDKGFTVEARAELEVVYRLCRANCAEWEFFRTDGLSGRQRVGGGAVVVPVFE